MLRAGSSRMVCRANPDLPPLPRSYDERENIKGRSGLEYILSVYARSLEAQKYDTFRHPTFDLYAPGVLASDYAPDFIKHDWTSSGITHRAPSPVSEPVCIGNQRLVVPHRHGEPTEDRALAGEIRTQMNFAHPH